MLYDVDGKCKPINRCTYIYFHIDSTVPRKYIKSFRPLGNIKSYDSTEKDSKWLWKNESVTANLNANVLWSSNLCVGVLSNNRYCFTE